MTLPGRRPPQLGGQRKQAAPAFSDWQTERHALRRRRPAVPVAFRGCRSGPGASLPPPSRFLWAYRRWRDFRRSTKSPVQPSAGSHVCVVHAVLGARKTQETSVSQAHDVDPRRAKSPKTVLFSLGGRMSFSSFRRLSAASLMTVMLAGPVLGSLSAPSGNYVVPLPVPRELTKVGQVPAAKAFGSSDPVTFITADGKVYQLTRFHGLYVDILLPGNWLQALSTDQILHFLDRTDLIYQHLLEIGENTAVRRWTGADQGRRTPAAVRGWAVPRSASRECNWRTTPTGSTYWRRSRRTSRTACSSTSADAQLRRLLALPRIWL